MPTTSIKHHIQQSFKYLSTALLIAVLALGGLPLSTAQAAAIKSQPKTASPGDPTADVALSIHPLESVMVGEDFTFYASFDNSGNPGYGPFIDLIFPNNGIDGAAGTDAPDGISFVSAAYDNYTFPAITPLTFPAPDPATVPTPTTTCVSHPFAMDATGTAVQVCGTPGDTLVVLELPFSSVTSDMPGLYVAVTAHVSELADVNAPLNILGRGGYRYGKDGLNNPASDPAILGATDIYGADWFKLTVTPQVVHIEKSSNALKECPYDPTGVGENKIVLDEKECPYGDVNPVYESVSGPNFPRQYTITVYVAAAATAPGHLVNNLDVTDYFPKNLVYVNTTAPGSASVVPPTLPDNQLVVHYNSLPSGTTTITVDFYIPQLDADGNPVLEPTTGNSVSIDNIASALGDWTPVDIRDTTTTGNALANPSHDILDTLNVRSIAVQKSVAISTDTGTVNDYNPGDTLEYTLNFQVSDYFSFDSLVLTDSLTDGQRVDSSFTPTLQIDGNGYTLATAAVGAANYDISCNYSGLQGPECKTNDPAADDGATKLTFQVSNEIITRGQNGRLLGGCVNPAGGMVAGCVPPSPAGDGPTTGVITFRAVVQESFSNAYVAPTDAFVDHGDALYNSVLLDGAILDNGTFAPVTGGSHQTDDSVQKIKMVHGCLTKTIYAINNVLISSGPTLPEIQPTDKITFRLQQTLPSSDSDKLTLTDYLPLPIFDVATTATTFVGSSTGDASIPGPGEWKFGPSVNPLNAALAAPITTPTITRDTTTNSLSFDFGSFDDPTDTSSVLDILYTVTVTNAPYADGSTLTNLAQGDERTTNSGDLYYFSGVQFKLKEPGITLHKGVVASNDSQAVFNPTPTGPASATFNAPGSATSWTGLIASGDNDPSTPLVNSNVSNVVGGDVLTFAVVLENLGHSSLGAFDVSFNDAKPASLIIPTTPAGLNLQVRSGDGVTPIAYTNIGSGLFDPAGGILITDESPTQGAAHMYDPANGKNLIVVTYDLEIDPSLTNSAPIANVATLLSYAGTESGPNHVGATTTNNVDNDNATITLRNAKPVITEGDNVNVTMSEDGSPIPFALTLTATDPNISDVLTWDIESDPAYGAAGVGATTGVVSYTPPLNYNGDASFVVRVSDGHPNGTDSINVHVTITPVSDSSDLIWNQSHKIQYDTWLGVEDVNAFSGDYRKATSGAFTFKPSRKFTDFKWITYRGPDQGKAQVLVDGVLKKTINLYSATAQWQSAVQIKGLKNTKHTVVIKALNAKDPASSGKWVVVDAFQVGSTIFNDDKIDVPYSDLFSYGSWLGKVQRPGPRFGAYRISSVKGASMKFSFTGQQFNWVTARGPAYGKAAIYVDGVLVKTVDLYSSKQQWQYRVSITPGYGTHTVEIRVLHIKNRLSGDFGVVSDGFEIN